METDITEAHFLGTHSSGTLFVISQGHVKNAFKYFDYFNVTLLYINMLNFIII